MQVDPGGEVGNVMIEQRGPRCLRGLILAMLLAGAAAPAWAAEVPASAERHQDVDEGRSPDWYLLAVACAGLVIGRIVVMRRVRPGNRPRR